MSLVFGDLELFGTARIINLKVESATLPTFDENDYGRLIANGSALFFNDGEKWSTFQFSNNSSEPLIDTLGRNWINEDFSFNPTAFNALDNISGLTSNDTLFDVISSLDAAISNIDGLSVEDLSDVNFSNIQIGDLFFYNGSGFSNIDLNALADAKLNLTTEKLKDIDISNDGYASGQTLVYSTADEKLLNQQFYAEYTNTAVNDTFVVTHNLGIKHCIVQIVNMQTHELVTSSYGVTFDNINQLTVTLVTPIGVKILMTGTILT